MTQPDVRPQPDTQPPDVRRLVDAIIPYVRHDTNCRFDEGEGCGPCTCGSAEALRLLRVAALALPASTGRTPDLGVEAVIGRHCSFSDEADAVRRAAPELMALGRAAPRETERPDELIERAEKYLREFIAYTPGGRLTEDVERLTEPMYLANLGQALFWASELQKKGYDEAPTVLEDLVKEVAYYREHVRLAARSGPTQQEEGRNG